MEYLSAIIFSNIEMVQKRALRCIHPAQSCDEINDSLLVPMLLERREKLCRDCF